MTDIRETPSIGGTPGGTNNTPAPTTGTTIPIGVSGQREYVAATGTAYYGNYWRALPWAFDDLTRDLDDSIYEQMLRDPQVFACLSVLKTGILEDGVQLSACVEDDDDPNAARAEAIRHECQTMLDDLSPSLDDTLWDLLDSLAYGNRVAEIIYDESLSIRAVKPKPREATAFVVDVYDNVIGLLARIPGVGTPVQAGNYIISVTPPYNLLPREKFAVLTFRPRNHDPRGTSILRPAYNAWWLKMQAWPQYLKFLVQFGTPSLIAYTAENAVPIVQNGVQVNPTQQAVDTLIQLQNGTAAAFPGGYQVDVINPAKEGIEGFIKAFRLYDEQITIAILSQTLATMEGEHQARAASETHADVLATIIRQAKRAVARMIRNDILKPYLRMRYGEAAVQFAPHVTLGSTEQRDVAGLWNALAALARTNYLDPSQFPALDALVNLPPRDMNATSVDDADSDPNDDTADTGTDEEEGEEDNDDNKSDPDATPDRRG